MNEIVGFFLGYRAKIGYEICIMLYLCGSLWSYTSVFASSLASNVPVLFLNGGETCKVSDDHSSACEGVYLWWVFIFSIFVVPLTCIEMTETKVVQVAMSALRFIAIAIMFAYL
jgi:hypothetical protein